jgi:histidine triad (HIT) family protein
MTAAQHCTFCDLIAGAAEVSVCYEDADAIAFMDIQPVNAGHVLVVPREHHESILDVPQELGVHLFGVTMRLVGAVQRVTKCEGVNIIVNSGAVAGQDEMHYHVHIIPRSAQDGFDVPLPFGGSEMPDRTVLDMQAARIIAALRDPMPRRSRSGSAGAAGQKKAAEAGLAQAATAGATGASTAAGSLEASAGAGADRLIEREVAVSADAVPSDHRPVAGPDMDIPMTAMYGDPRAGFDPGSGGSEVQLSAPRPRLHEGAHGELVSGD